LDRGHPGKRGGRDVTDEPHIGEAEHDLDCAVRHERQGEREHRPLVNMGNAGGVDFLCRQTSGHTH
jgi:hypothetical protein